MARIWGVDPSVLLATRAAAARFEEETRREVWITSGYRTKAEQDALRSEGRPAAPDNVSTHRSCPATGIDISLGFLPTRVQKAIWGRHVVMQGLRWGGGGPVDDLGIPDDWQHVDRGRRNT